MSAYAEWEAALAVGTPFRSEFRLNRNDDRELWIFCVAEIVLDAAGVPARLIAALMDITERKRGEIDTLQAMAQMREHEDRQKLLLDELNHRVKNTLASVQSVAVQSLRDAQDLRGARDLFIERLMALSSTHNLLVKRGREGATLRELAEMTLRPYGHPYVVQGPDLKLDPNFAVARLPRRSVASPGSCLRLPTDGCLAGPSGAFPDSARGDPPTVFRCPPLRD